jgi:hypothetical protein
MSAYGLKADIKNWNVRFSPEYVCLTPNSGPYLTLRWMSAYDP